MNPTIEITPARPLTSPSEVTDLLVRITPTAEATPAPRPPLDLAVVIDTSGSMNGLPLQLAKEAVVLVNQTLSPEDRLSVVSFNSGVQVVLPLQKIGPAERLQRQLDRLHAGGSTALHGGWQMGSALLQGDAMPGNLPRVLLLTDGRANVGVTQPRAIAADVALALSRSVSTSTVGVGMRYDEQVLESIAWAGDGNYHFAETPEALPGLFEAELESLRTTVGRLASLGISGVEVVDVLNDLRTLPTGRLALPPLRAERSLDLLLRIKARAGETLGLRLAWTDAWDQRQTHRAFFVLPQAESDSVASEHPEVVRVRAGLLAARVQRVVAMLASLGKLEEALATLESSRSQLEMGIRSGLNLSAELETVAELERRLRKGERQSASKFAGSRAYSKTTGRDDQTLKN
ncbi:vWA domain-containing protein [Deinococcus sp.]|uniref:vWA domain-containing protein n=1 Tax=Deinococcus sp. TaxID=47478 RepID=UPI003C7C3AED